ncbi:conserved hypothetical protein [Neospora caninum Liverpool]|uniref:Uncharacterized protein n=1 Tax=Neospora caninum (strain Liverpool) TaxID=572307 RepID=F0VC14_NEOCL|nr:conserved hypothetical protein [Neospora caninum Liverpool]CBZ51148.1 conserved hypothetical protein [Neospora caninum Liverpool]CEL68457.1 TPA: hypothetical protein BN1204_042230 [Neospora caninum Liverpool]|eukprot:XP_003881181.1 conserved hypothetical protein [Neospora caninum Liverpool]
MATSLHSRLVAAMPRNAAELSKAFDLDDMVQKKTRRQSSGVIVPGGARGLVVRTYRGILEGSEDDDPDSANPEAHQVQVAWADGSVENIARDQIELVDRPFYAGDLVVSKDGKSLGLVVEEHPDSVGPLRVEDVEVTSLEYLPLPPSPPLLRPLQAFEVGTTVIKDGHLGAVISCKVDYLIKLDSGHEFTLEHGMEGVRPEPRQGYPTEAYGMFPSQRIYVTGEWLDNFQQQLQTRQERRERQGAAEEASIGAHRLCRGVVKSFAVRRVKVNWLLENSESWSSAPPPHPLASQASDHDCSELLPLQQFVLRLGQPVYVNIRHHGQRASPSGLGALPVSDAARAVTRGPCKEPASRAPSEPSREDHTEEQSSLSEQTPAHASSPSSSSSSSSPSSSSSSPSTSGCTSPEPLYRLGVVEGLATRCCVLWDDGSVTREEGRQLTPVNVDRVPLGHSEFVVSLAILPHMYVTKKLTQDDLDKAAQEEEAAEARARAAGPAWWNAPYFGDTELGPDTAVPEELKAVEVVRALSRVCREMGIADYLGSNLPLDLSLFDAPSNRTDRGTEPVDRRATPGLRRRRERRGQSEGESEGRRTQNGETVQASVPGDERLAARGAPTDAESAAHAERKAEANEGGENESGGSGSGESGRRSSNDDDAWEDCGSEEDSDGAEGAGDCVAPREVSSGRGARLACVGTTGLVTGASVQDAVEHLQDLFQCLQDAVGPGNLNVPIYKRIPVLRSPPEPRGEERGEADACATNNAASRDASRRTAENGDAGPESNPSAAPDADASTPSSSSPSSSSPSSSSPSSAEGDGGESRRAQRRSRSPEAEAPARLHALMGRMVNGELRRRELFQFIEFIRMAGPTVVGPSGVGDGSWVSASGQRRQLDPVQIQGIINCVLSLRGEAALSTFRSFAGARNQGRFGDREVGVVVCVNREEKTATVAWLTDPEAFFARARSLRTEIEAETREARSRKDDLHRRTELQLARFGIAMWNGGRPDRPREDATGALYRATAGDYTAGAAANLVRVESVPVTDLSPLSRFLFFPGDCALLVDETARLSGACEGRNADAREGQAGSLEPRENAKNDKVYLQVVAACGGLVWCRTFDGRLAPFAPNELVPLNTRWCDLEPSYEESSDEESEYSESEADESSEDDSEDRETQSYESWELDDEWESDSGSTNVTDLSDPVGNGPSRCSSVERMSDQSQDVAGG